MNYNVEKSDVYSMGMVILDLCGLDKINASSH